MRFLAMEKARYPYLEDGAKLPKRSRTCVTRLCLLRVIVLLIVLYVLGAIVYLLWPWRGIVPAREEDCVVYKDSAFPPKVHRIWWSGTVPYKYRKYVDHCTDLNPGYKNYFWNKTTVNNLLEKHYPWALELFSQYALPMNRFDAAKYFIMHHHGGIYLDMDMDCVKPFDDIIKETGKDDDVILGESFPIGVVSNFFMAKANHPFFKQCINNLPNTKDEVFLVSLYETFLKAGPIFIFKNYFNYPCKERISVLDKYKIRWGWLIHDGKGTWTKLDGAVVLFVANHLASFFFTTSTFQYTIFLLCLIAAFAIRYFHRNRKSWPRSKIAIYNNNILNNSM